MGQDLRIISNKSPDLGSSGRVEGKNEEKEIEKEDEEKIVVTRDEFLAEHLGDEFSYLVHYGSKTIADPDGTDCTDPGPGTDCPTDCADCANDCRDSSECKDNDCSDCGDCGGDCSDSDCR